MAAGSVERGMMRGCKVSLSDARKAGFIEFMLDCEVLRFGDFTTKSGRQTPYFLNTGRYMLGSQLATLGGYYGEVINARFGQEFNNLFGPAYKGIPLVVAVSMQLAEHHDNDVTITFNRKEAKDHGEGGLLVGDRYQRDVTYRVVIVEDIVTAGTSVRESLEILSKIDNVEVVGLVVSVDRMERGLGERAALAELADQFDIQVASIVNLTDLLSYLETKQSAGDPIVSADQLEKMRAYYREYGGK